MKIPFISKLKMPGCALRRDVLELATLRSIWNYLIWPICSNRPIIWDNFEKKTLITCPLSMAPSMHLLLCTRLCCSNKELWLLYCLVHNEVKWFLKEHSYYHAPFAFYEIFFKFIPVVLKDGSLTTQFILVLSFVHLVLLNHS